MKKLVYDRAIDGPPTLKKRWTRIRCLQCEGEGIVRGDDPIMCDHSPECPVREGGPPDYDFIEVMPGDRSAS